MLTSTAILHKLYPCGLRSLMLPCYIPAFCADILSSVGPLQLSKVVSVMFGLYDLYYLSMDNCDEKSDN